MTLESYWYIVLRSNRLKKKPKHVQMFGKHIVVYRAGDEVAAMEDRCAHRNVALSEGYVCDQQLVCPYHGWEYDKQGNVSNIPNLDETSEKPKVAIPSYHCIEQDGYIWLCIGEKPDADKPSPLPEINSKGWVSIHETALFDASVPNVLENFLDIPHAIYVHNFWFRKTLKKSVEARVVNTKNGAAALLEDEPRDKGVLWSIVGKKQVSMKHTDGFVAPATSQIQYEFSNGRHYYVSSCCTPVSDKQTLVHTIITFNAGWKGAFTKLVLTPLAKLLIKQDVDITRLQQENIDRFGGTQRFRVTDVDLMYPQIIKWRNALEKNASKPKQGEVKRLKIRL